MKEPMNKEFNSETLNDAINFRLENADWDLKMARCVCSRIDSARKRRNMWIAASLVSIFSASAITFGTGTGRTALASYFSDFQEQDAVEAFESMSRESLVSPEVEEFVRRGPESDMPLSGYTLTGF